MSCPACDGAVVVTPVPEELRPYLPDDRPGLALCTRCLTVTPHDDPPATVPDLAAVSTAFPPDPDRAVPLVVLLALLDRLALYRTELEAVATVAERRGVDPLLVLDRLATDDALEPALDLPRRRTQLAQVL